jgi:hypothetical protein
MVGARTCEVGVTRYVIQDPNTWQQVSSENMQLSLW